LSFKIDIATPDIATANCNGFEIGRLENKLRYHIVIAPHRHTYYEVFWSVKGTGAHYIDFVSYEMSPNTLFFISPGQIHYSDIASCIGYALFFTEEFLLSNHVPKSFLNRLPFYHAEGQEQAVVGFAIVGGFLYFLANLVAFSNLPQVVAAVLVQGETPAVILMAKVLLGEQLNRLQWLGVLIALLGAGYLSYSLLQA
jgi:hypothetical protein